MGLIVSGGMAVVLWITFEPYNTFLSHLQGCIRGTSAILQSHFVTLAIFVGKQEILLLTTV